MIPSVTAAGALMKRFAAQGLDLSPERRIPPYAGFVFFADFLIFLPASLMIGYTFQHVYPTLAAVEDPDLASYEFLPVNDVNDKAAVGSNKKQPNPVAEAKSSPSAHSSSPQAVTSSIRQTARLLRSLTGWPSFLRGLGYGLLSGFAFLTLWRLLALVLPFDHLLAYPLALIATAPLHAAWTHSMVAVPSHRSFFSRIPSLRSAYRATWLPVLLFSVLSCLSTAVPDMLISLVAGPDTLNVLMRPSSATTPASPPEMSPYTALKLLVIVVLSVLLKFVLVIPAHVALVRVQTTLLPADEDTIVRFDRSFGGRVESVAVCSKCGFALLRAALASVTFQSWRRIVLLRVKLFALAIAMYLAMGAILGVQVMLMRRA
ncbi:uncharacterized protein CTHT_0034310 [Thermochaetoides thermophila DSM 1495]|uniref:Uncharacterized protein n=1 Tax=Chaetomium thermophilum (strain DSM 1495 / CBS 144.50 / IMI 039719) TaxID=759272 RepID=G0S662_CHATD|nr:hypothetical protein CTHT_0034310 [Thermochaetoides thermophila DSM 1495]EGS21570.1 hypothetical protein CTHT_0034310 [Thermochaetoides thermophila DSM 1495]